MLVPSYSSSSAEFTQPLYIMVWDTLSPVNADFIYGCPLRLELIGHKGTPSNVVLPHCSSFLFPLSWSVNNGIKCNVLRSMIPKKVVSFNNSLTG